ncbi:MAG: ddaH [Labilithrix sp.]|nr:ddaH [Labilithrix sp.]
MPLVAVTHLPSPHMNDALRTFVDVAPIDLAKVAEEHAAYRALLARAGASLVVLDGSLGCADAVFVEDTAVVLDEVAVLTSMGARARRAEIPAVEAELRKHREEVARLTLPATLDGGDVLRVGRTLLVGASGRTNAGGFQALSSCLRPFGYDMRVVKVTGCLHLKTACTALPDGSLLVNPRWVDLLDLEGFTLVPVAEDEPGAANVVLANDHVITASGNPRTRARIEERGFTVWTTDLSEIAKAEGSATCLSILVPDGAIEAPSR